jgi:hypothetical protein
MRPGTTSARHYVPANSAVTNVPNFGFMALPRCLKVSISDNNRRVPVRHVECSVRDRRKRTVGFIESAMPADGIPRCPYTSNGDIGTSRLEEQL